jgi:hypothetical protein
MFSCWGEISSDIWLSCPFGTSLYLMYKYLVAEVRSHQIFGYHAHLALHYIWCTNVQLLRWDLIRSLAIFSLLLHSKRATVMFLQVSWVCIICSFPIFIFLFAASPCLVWWKAAIFMLSFLAQLWLRSCKCLDVRFCNSEFQNLDVIVICSSFV